MAFLLGSFTSGMFSGLDATLSAGKKLTDFKKDYDMMKAAGDAADASKVGTDNPGASGAGTPFSTGKQNIRSDSAISAPTPSSTTNGPVDLGSVMPPKYMSDKQNIRSDSAISAPTAQAAPATGVVSPVNHSGGHFYNPPTGTAPSNMQTYDDPQGMATQQPPPRAPATLIPQQQTGGSQALPIMAPNPNQPGAASDVAAHDAVQPSPSPAHTPPSAYSGSTNYHRQLMQQRRDGVPAQPQQPTLIPQQQGGPQAMPTRGPQQPAPPIAAAPNANTPSLAQQTGGLGSRLLSAMGTSVGMGY